MGNIVSLDRFIPYELEDIGVIIPHSSRMINRWKWFWPQYQASVPKQVLKNTYVVYHMRDGAAPVPENILAVKEVAHLVVLDRKGASVIWPVVEGIKHCRTRIILKIDDDVEIVTPEWAELALMHFNREPHLKILGVLSCGGLVLTPAEKIYQVPFVDKHLFHGNYSDIGYIHGTAVIANRAIWMAYYSELERYEGTVGSDLLFSTLCRADGVPIINFGHLFRHRAQSHRDEIFGVTDAA